VEGTAKEALPFLAVTLGVLLLVTFVPDIALWLPQRMGYLG
jgi:TRAP-type C4-dicarboxylate transport system permease large subunit